MNFKIGKTKWQIIHYVGLGFFTVYRNGKKAKGLHMGNDFEGESEAMLAILKYYQVDRLYG